MTDFIRRILFFQVLLVFLLCVTVLSCQREPNSQAGLPHFVIENHKIRDKEDLSSHFQALTIEVDGATSARIPGVTRNFAYTDSTLFLIYPQRNNQIVAVDLDGNIKWDLVADSDPLTSFSSLSAYHFDLENQEINVFDDQKHRIYVYDFMGEHLRTEEIPTLYINDFFLLPTGERLFSTNAMLNTFEDNQDKTALVAYFAGNNTATPDQILLKNPFYDPNRIRFSDTHDFFRDGQGNTFYHRDFGDTLFQIQNMVAVPRLTYSYAENDKRRQVLTDPKSNPIILANFLEGNIPYSNFIGLLADDYLLKSYTYNRKEYFTMIDLDKHETVFNTELFQCNGKHFSGRLDYSSGVLLNQMYAGNYQQLNGQQRNDDEFEDSSLIYTILTPK